VADRERWRRVPGWPAYKVSSRGRVKSVPRELANGRDHGGGPLAQTPDDDGYLYVTLHGGGRSRRVHVAVLVLEAFDRAKPEGMEACHGRDGHQVNWWPSNLRWGTHRENEQDKRRTEDGNRREVSRPSLAVTAVTGDVQR
jgi:hypothetical protein